MTYRVIAFLKYVLIFIRELWNANITVVKLVLSPTLKIKPGFISVPMTVRGDFEVTSYANSITLTPGTISVHIPDDRHAIVIHAIDIGDNPDDVRQSCTNALEKPILRWSRGESDGAKVAAQALTRRATASDEVGAKPTTGADDSDRNAGDSI